MSKKNVNVENTENQETETVEVLSTRKARFAEGCKRVGSKAKKTLKWVGLGVGAVGLAALSYGAGRNSGRKESSFQDSEVLITDSSAYEDAEE